MAGSKIFFHSNIRFLRERKKYSQEEMAQLLDLSRNKLQALESGKTRNPSADDLLNFSDHFKISIDSLMRVDLLKLGELKLRELMAGNDVYLTGTNIRVLAITVDKANKENIEYVPIKAKAGYKSGYNDPDYISSLPKLSLPGLSKHVTYRMFPTIGDSMLPVPEGSDILAKYIQDWTNIKAGTLCIVILKGDQDFVFKKVKIMEDDTVELSSLNKRYSPFSEPFANILEIWEFDRYVSKQVPEAATDLQDLKNMIMQLRVDVMHRG